MTEKIHLQKDEKDLILSFAIRLQKCWICDSFLLNFQEDEIGHFLPVEIFEDDGMIEHLEQLIQRKISFD